MNKQIKDLKPWDVKRIDAMFEEHGTDRYGVGIVARAFSLTESAAEAMATAIKERDAPKSSTRAITETDPLGSAPPTATNNVHKQHLASVLVAQVNAAEAKIEADGGSMAALSLQQLEALAAARFG